MAADWFADAIWAAGAGHGGPARAGDGRRDEPRRPPVRPMHHNQPGTRRPFSPNPPCCFGKPRKNLRHSREVPNWYFLPGIALRQPSSSVPAPRSPGRYGADAVVPLSDSRSGFLQYSILLSVSLLHSSLFLSPIHPVLPWTFISFLLIQIYFSRPIFPFQVFRGCACSSADPPHPSLFL